MNNTTNNKTNNIESFMNFPCFEEVDCIPVTMQELKAVQPLMARQWDVLEETEEVIDYFRCCVTNARYEAKRKANKHETKFYLGGDFSRRTYSEAFVNNHRQGIELECLVTEDVLVRAIKTAGERTDLKMHNDEKMVKLHIRIPQDNLKEMYDINQTKN